MSDVIPEGQRLIDDWLACTREIQLCRSALSTAECAERNAHNALAKWLTPCDTKPGEKIAVWHDDLLIQVELEAEPEYQNDGAVRQAPPKPRVTIRTRGKRLG